MTPGTYNFKVYPGADIALAFAVTGMNLDGYTARSKMRATWDASIVYDLPASIADTDPTWTISASVPGDTTTTFQRPSFAAPTETCVYYWDLELVAPGGQIYRFLQGQATVFPEATR